MRTVIKGALLATGALLAMANTPAGADPADDAAAAQTLTFNNGDGPIAGKVIWTSGTTRQSWRAGSGNGPNWNNECVRNEGHLPLGKYKIKAWHDNYPGNLIHGRAVELENKECRTGTMRTELFIHSEQTVNNTQGTTEGTRWDGDNDYKSEGCVKLHPNDIAALYKVSADAGARPTVLSVVS
jgi:hypothetical protein